MVGAIVLAVIGGCGAGPLAEVDASFSLLSYNVAGLPQGLSSSDPERTIPLISPRLNDWDLVLAQEDFAYQRELRAEVEHEHQSWPKEPEQLALGDGLNRFSRLAFAPSVERHRWETCNGLTGGSNDCLAEKGFSYAEHEVAPGVTVGVVNLHMDAGGGTDDVAARAEQVEQLIAWAEESASGPLIVAGDTNIRPSRDEPGDDDNLARLLAGLELEDACVPIRCGEEDRIDRVLLRSGDGVGLTGLSYRLAEELVDDEGQPLSDHMAVEVRMGVRSTAAP